MCQELRIPHGSTQYRVYKRGYRECWWVSCPSIFWIFADVLSASEFQDDLGPLAGMHVDEHDSPGGYTCMITFSDLDQDDHPGWFMLAEVGAAIRKLPVPVSNIHA